MTKRVTFTITADFPDEVTDAHLQSILAAAGVQISENEVYEDSEGFNPIHVPVGDSHEAFHVCHVIDEDITTPSGARALDNALRQLASRAWAKHPNNPVNKEA